MKSYFRSYVACRHLCTVFFIFGNVHHNVVLGRFHLGGRTRICPYVGTSVSKTVFTINFQKSRFSYVVYMCLLLSYWSCALKKKKYFTNKCNQSFRISFQICVKKKNGYQNIIIIARYVKFGWRVFNMGKFDSKKKKNVVLNIYKKKKNCHIGLTNEFALEKSACNEFRFRIRLQAHGNR